jgi:hypothetical protein
MRPAGRIISATIHPDMAGNLKIGMNGMRRALGILLIIAGPFVVAFGYLTAPSASSCAAANKISLDLGQPASCATTPSILYFVGGAVLLIVGVLLVLPWSRRPYGAR